jgi:hypothetical protein
MPKECVLTVIINMDGIKSPGTALMKNYTPTGCARIATLIPIIGKEDSRDMKKMKMCKYKLN